MKYINIFAALLFLGLAANAAPVDQKTAQRAGSQYLINRGIIKASDTLSLAATYAATPQAAAFYIFNHSQGFIIVSADTRCTPVLGHSERGAFDRSRMASNMLGWFEGYRECIEEGILANAPEDPASSKAWQAVLDGTLPAADAKSSDYLLTSTWSQGSGYNNYCPVWNGEHVVVGCVATAMSQIMRYHRYPSRGFGFKQYRHPAYGMQAVDFDTTEYDYDLMPDDVDYWYASDEEIDMVSRFCWHAGITVSMEYRHAGHTEGSGAHSRDVPEALTHFGYTQAMYIEKGYYSEADWRNMIIEEIDARRPIYYSGAGSNGGHAFVLDGYDNSNQYHFNWGWGGYGDGFYTLTTMQGFTTDQDMVIHIIPSGWDGHLDRFYVSPDGHGGGTSWNDCGNDLSSAAVLSKLTSKPIWMKEGTYYGDTAAEYAYSLTKITSIFGGFSGNEEDLSERDIEHHPTILDGQGLHGVLYAYCTSNNNEYLTLNGLTIQNGYSRNGSSLYLRGNAVHADNIILQHCNSDSGSAAYIQDCRVRYVRAHSNQAPVIIDNSGANLRQSLIANNDGTAIRLATDARLVGCDVVSNNGTGVVYANSRSTIVNTVLWNNDTNLQLHATPQDTSIRRTAIEGDIFVIDSIASDSAMVDSLIVRLDSQNTGSDHSPRFMQPSERGSLGYSTSNDWQIQEGSALINAGERTSDSKSDSDLNRDLRMRQGCVDIGCYESRFNLGIGRVLTDDLRICPNPVVASTLLSGTSACSIITLYDINGRQVLRQQADEGCTSLDLSALPSGIYLLRCGDSTAKVMKQ